MSCLFVILQNQGLARVGANQYMHYFYNNFTKKNGCLRNYQIKSASVCSSPSFYMHALPPLLHVFFLSRHLLKEEKNPVRLLIQKHPSTKKIEAN